MVRHMKMTLEEEDKNKCFTSNMFSFCQLFRYKPVEEPGKRGGFLERLLTVVTSALQVIIIMVPEVIMVVVVVLILVMMVMIVMVVVILVGLDSEA